MQCAGTVTRIEGQRSDVRLKGTSGFELVCQLVSVFAAVPRCAEAHAPAFVKLFMKVCERLIEPIDFSQATLQVSHFHSSSVAFLTSLDILQVEGLLETIGRNNASKFLVSGWCRGGSHVIALHGVVVVHM
jgi:hypothetical protein